MRHVVAISARRSTALAATCAVVCMLFASGSLSAVAAEYAARRVEGGIRIEIVARRSSGETGRNQHISPGAIDVSGLPDVDTVGILRDEFRPGKSISVERLLQLAAILEAAHRSAGYLLAKAYLPPQTIRPGGRAVVEIIDVQLEDVQTEGVSENTSGLVRGILSALIGCSKLRLSEYERQLAIARRQLGLQLVARLEPGSRPDRVRLLVQGKDKPVTGEISGGRFSSVPYSRYSLQGSAAILSPFGLGERVYLGGSLNSRTEQPVTSGRPSNGLAGVSIPLGVSGTTVDLFGTSAGERRTSLGQYWLDYRYGLTGARLSYPILLSEREALVIRAGPDFAHEQQAYRISSPPSRLKTGDNFVVGRAGLQWTRQGAPDWVTDVQVEAAFGRSRRSFDFRYDDPAYETFSERKEARLGKLEARARAEMPIADLAKLILIARLQYSVLDPLPASEQIQLLGVSNLPGLVVETAQADHGGLLRGEIARDYAITTPFKAVVTPYLFTAGGLVSNRRPVEGQNRTVRGVSAGLGVRAIVPVQDARFEAIDVAVELARVETDGPTRDHTALSGRIGLRF